MSLTPRDLLATPLLLAGGVPPGRARIPGGTFYMGTDAATIDTRYAHFSPRVREMAATGQTDTAYTTWRATCGNSVPTRGRARETAT